MEKEKFVILDGQQFVTIEGKLIVALLIMWPLKYFKEINMTKL
jgi:hypothetical protein